MEVGSCEEAREIAQPSTSVSLISGLSSPGHWGLPFFQVSSASRLSSAELVSPIIRTKQTTLVAQQKGFIFRIPFFYFVRITHMKKCLGLYEVHRKYKPNTISYKRRAL